MTEKLWFLKRCDLFGQLSADELSFLEAAARLKKFAARCPIYLPVDRPQSVLLLTAGRVRIGRLSPEGKEFTLALIEPGELFGELALVDCSVREEFAEAVQESTIVMIPREALERVLGRHPETALGITRLFGLRRRRIEQRLTSLLFQPQRTRLLNLILELAERYGRPTDAGVLIDLRLSHRDLASLIGSSRESVTLALSELETEGRIVRQRRRIVVTDLESLQTDLMTAQQPLRKLPELSGKRGVPEELSL